MKSFVAGLLLVAAGYLVLGMIFALVSHVRGLGRVDAGARDAGPGFRLLITPGIVALWPLLAWRWRRWSLPEEAPSGAASAPRRMRRLHGLAWKLLAVLVPVILAVALRIRPGPPAAFALNPGQRAAFAPPPSTSPR